MLAEHIRPAPNDIGDRSDTVGASEIGHCARQVYYRKHDQAPEREDGWGYRTRGHVVEAWVMERLAAAKVPVENVQKRITRGFLSCTVDLALQRVPIDIKSIDPRVSRLPKPAHVLQSQVQSGLWGADSGWLVYVDCSDFSNIREFEIPAVDIEPLQARARDIMTGPLPPPEGRIAGGDECEFCLFQVACLGAPIEGKGKLSDGDRVKIEAAIARAKQADEAKEAQEALRNRAREEIRDILRAADVSRAPKLARISRRQNTALDTEAMTRDGVDLAKYRKAGRMSESVTLE